MSYRVVLGRQAEKDLIGLSDPIQTRIQQRLRSMKEAPFPRGVVKLQGEGVEGWRIRVGDYRILYTVAEKAKLVRVYKIGHRKDVYR